ncbi:hypothetical protein KOM00_12120 [Geomonas sp. Red69]|uniref:Uncharacterized protein n=1 Tax=Geomonas diazotrophica TaxID=2843197 RepID=A0ABX8JJF8_9BACT|nr:MULTISPECIES: hypothetical protein [Geomonas]MBU5637476.1 hypothetical protein [Geomonas diazotrophica]QWV97858.1 hypothetical protein KP005_00745 [Geomonas nitrogeniifigens]QXE86998.1 hypothetical protein KP003_00890 [Geomonas nitrogeniifigens]
MKLRATGVIGQDDDGHIVLELKKGQDVGVIKSHVGEEVEMVILTKETATKPREVATSEKDSEGLSTCAKPGYWNIEDQQ